MKVGLYARVSTEEQGENYSIPSQLSLMREMAQKRGYEVFGEYIDIGYPGTTAQRPDLQRLLSDIAEKKVQAVMVKCVDRLARGVRPLSAVMDVLETHGCKLEFVEFAYDGSPMSQAMLEIQAAIGRMERDLFAQRVRAGRLQKTKSGRLNPLPCAKYGYDYDTETETFKTNEEEAKWVCQAFEWCIEGVSTQGIAMKLNQLGILTKLQRIGRESRGWTRRRVQILLKSTEYYGNGYAHKTTRDRNGKGVKRPKEEWIPFGYPAIISEELFVRTQDRLKQERRFSAPREKKAQFLLNGLLYCKECGYRFYTIANPNSRRLADGTLKYYPDKLKRHYMCVGMTDYPHLHQCRSPKRVSAQAVEEVVWTAVKEAFRNPELIQKGLSSLREDAEGRKLRLAEELQHLRKRVEDVTFEEHRLITAYRKNLITETQLDMQLRATREEKETWQHELARLEKSLTTTQERVDLYEKARVLCAALDRLDRRPCEDRREFLRALVDKVWLDKEGKVTIEAALKGLTPQPTVGEMADSPTYMSARCLRFR